MNGRKKSRKTRPTVIQLPLDEFEQIKLELRRLDKELSRLLSYPRFETDRSGRVRVEWTEVAIGTSASTAPSLPALHTPDTASSAY